MEIVEINHKKDALIITILLFLALLLSLFFLKYYNKPALVQFEGGGGGGNIEVNFGDSDKGLGKNFEATESIKSKTVTQKAFTDETEDLLTSNSDNENLAVISSSKKPKVETKKSIDQPKAIEKSKIAKSTNDALQNIINANAGDGNDDIQGNKGKLIGKKKPNGYDATGGSGAGSGFGSGQGIGTGSGYGSGAGTGIGNGATNYQLSGRKALSKPSPRYDCNEQGTVVVQIKVNNAGQVVEATAGVKGTTNSANCLTLQAKTAAMNTKFDANNAAPEKQVGKIVYNFKLSE